MPTREMIATSQWRLTHGVTELSRILKSLVAIHALQNEPDEPQGPGPWIHPGADGHPSTYNIPADLAGEFNQRFIREVIVSTVGRKQKQ